MVWMRQILFYLFAWCSLFLTLFQALNRTDHPYKAYFEFQLNWSRKLANLFSREKLAQLRRVYVSFLKCMLNIIYWCEFYFSNFRTPWVEGKPTIRYKVDDKYGSNPILEMYYMQDLKSQAMPKFWSLTRIILFQYVPMFWCMVSVIHWSWKRKGMKHKKEILSVLSISGGARNWNLLGLKF